MPIAPRVVDAKVAFARVDMVVGCSIQNEEDEKYVYECAQVVMASRLTSVRYCTSCMFKAAQAGTAGASVAALAWRVLELDLMPS